jgi:hypothetical protein
MNGFYPILNEIFLHLFLISWITARAIALFQDEREVERALNLT